MTMLSRIDRVLSRSGKGVQGVALSSVEERESGEAASVIGERFETIQDSLDQLTDMARRFGTFETLLGQLRDPLEAEFRSRRDSHVELINLRAANAESGGRLDDLSAEARRLADALAESEGRADELSARHGEQTAALQDARVEADRLRSELSQATGKVEALELNERASGQRIKELEQDQEALRTQLKQAESLRTESETGRAQIQRDHALVLEENTVLRRRIDEVSAEIAALARTSAASEGQLATERARAASEQSETARALRALENQTETARAEIASLSSRLETATARANGLEVLNTEQASRLSELQSGSHGTERRAEQLQISLDRAMERIRGLEGETEDTRQRLAGMEVARLAAVDRAEALTKAATAHEKAIARAEDRMLKIQAKLAAAQDEHHAKTQTMLQQTTALRAELEGARAEAAMSAAALDAARRERGGRPAAVEGGGSVQSIVA
jgi:crescentin